MFLFLDQISASCSYKKKRLHIVFLTISNQLGQKGLCRYILLVLWSCVKVGISILFYFVNFPIDVYNGQLDL